MKLTILVFLTIVHLSFLTQAQIIIPTRFPLQDDNQNNNESFLLGLPNNNVLMFWHDSSNAQIKMAKSMDGGSSWSGESIVVTVNPNSNAIDLNAVALNTGRVLLTYKLSSYYYIYSDNNGDIWSSPTILPTSYSPVFRFRAFLSSLSRLSSGEIIFVHSISNSTNVLGAKGIFTIKSIDGISWTSADTIDLEGKNGYIFSTNDSKDILVYQDSTENDNDIFYRTSSDAANLWSERSILTGGILSQSNPKGIRDLNGKTWVYYTQDELTPFNGITQSDIKYISSMDDGITWSDPENFTKYVGYDINHNISLWNGRPIVVFNSTRNFSLTDNHLQIYYTLADVSVDNNVPPFMYKFLHSLVNPGPYQPYLVQTFVDDDKEINSIKLSTYTTPPGIYETIEMYDDGVHNDSLSGDHIYGATIIPQNYGDWISYSFILEDNDFNIVEFQGSFIEVPFVYASDSYLFNINNLSLPLDNRGILAAVDINGIKDLDFEESSVLFSGGFYLSGYNNYSLWANAVASASLVQDYQAGPVGSDIMDPLNKIYFLKSDDEEFGPSWQVYAHAVEQGADYYDGNNDGIYNPVDLNGNSAWDFNEDRPDFIGDLTAWCVFNDGIPATQRRWNDQNPMGIEIQQTLFAWGENVNDPIDNMIFIRYRIINKGTISDKFDSVYFSCWADPDLGKDSYYDDLVGSDINLNLGYVYNYGEDVSYGANPPAFGIPFLQGPASYILGETFIDNNGNGIFDIQSDIPLDTAYLNNGPIMGMTFLPGAKNQDMSSFTHYMQSHPEMGDPNTGFEARNYMLGFNKLGNLIDPCTWAYGAVFGGVNCAMVDPRFLYSGNPVNNAGWLNTYYTDQRILENTGPFSLEVNKPIDILACYLVGRGSDALNSVTVMKDISEEAIQIYKSNFTDIPTGILNHPEIVKEFKLSQNYPNPFNPSTIISYQIPVEGNVSLKVYDVLGNEVATLVDEYRPAGMYNVQCTMNNLSSGIYFYQLKAGYFVETKKMILLK